MDVMSDELDVFMLTYGIVEEGGGPGIAVTGFARALAQRGDRVHVAALARSGRWMVDASIARDGGYELTIGRAEQRAAQIAELIALISRRARTARKPVVWVNGIWGPPSVAAAAVHALTGCPYVMRPAGSLGIVALQYRALKKRIYYQAIERWILRRASRIHCMSDVELRELPEDLRARAFVVPSGVAGLDAPVDRVDDGELRIGMLARLDPIKRQHLALDAVELLVAGGLNVTLEFAGDPSVASYSSSLRARVAASDVLRPRVRFLEHVEQSRVPAVLRRWRVGLLLSEQENFGHAALVVAAAGVPLILTHGVALAAGAHRRRAAVIAEPNGRAIATAIRQALANEAAMSVSARAYASGFSWDACGEKLHRELDECVRSAGFASARGRD
jgi:glycosyltransferase involved in cell wall biosynthesis